MKSKKIQNNSKIVILGVFVILVVIAIYFAGNFFGTNPPVPPPTPVANTPQFTIGGIPFTIEIADTDAKRAKGLSGRQPLPQNHGMLFVFDHKSQYGFWMKEMNFGLDFIWIDGDTVVEITENVPAPISAAMQLPIYQPKVPIDKMLEVNAGTAAKNGLTVGQKVSGL